MNTPRLDGLINLAFQAAPACLRLAAFHRLGLVGGPVGTSLLGTLSFGGRVVDLAIQATKSFRLAGVYGIGLAGGPEALHPVALRFN